jgi:aminoglycoside/choline kinase family phosphotransferase
MIKNFENKTVVVYRVVLPSHSFAGASTRYGDVLINCKSSDSGRMAALKTWINSIDEIAGAEPVPASEDASFRRYFRVQAEGGSFIVMDAPPDKEDSRPFVRVAEYLRAIGVNAPRILEANLQDGFLLVSDLGHTQYLQRLRERPEAAPALYEDALRALNRLQNRGSKYQASLPSYDESLLRFELSLFHDWLCEKYLGITFDASEEATWQALCDLLVANALEQPSVFVHRDYHSRNLMVTRDDNPGILDFQDAVEGPITYDLVSLLKDCYISWPRSQLDQWLAGFYARIDADLRRQVGEREFRRFYDLMGVQRHLKAAGIFARLNLRDGKAGYMADIPRTLGYILRLSEDYAELDFLVRLVGERCLPHLGSAP